MGGGYEHCCQVMLDAGLAWMRAHPDAQLVYQGFRHVYGVAVPDTDASKELDAVLHAAAEPVGA